MRGTRGKTQERENTEKHKEIALSNTKTSWTGLETQTHKINVSKQQHSGVLETH